MSRSQNRTEFFASLEQMKGVGEHIAKILELPACVYLTGNLGAGKTTLCQSVISALGNQSTVTSPTYNLIQEYRVDSGIVYHMDLYRVEDSSELEFLALPDLWQEDVVFLIEWPDKGGAYIPAATHSVEIMVDNSNAESSRVISIIECVDS